MLKVLGCKIIFYAAISPFTRKNQKKGGGSNKKYFTDTNNN